MSSEVTQLFEKQKKTKNIITYAVILLIFVVALWLSTKSEGPSKFPKVVTDQFTFTAWVNEGEDFLKKNYRWMTKIIAGYIKEGYTGYGSYISLGNIAKISANASGGGAGGVISGELDLSNDDFTLMK